MRAVFMGTPQFAVPSLERMIQEGMGVAAVVTQPDKTRGRGRKIIYSPVKQLALDHGIPVYQPVRIRRDEEFKQTLREIMPDVIVVVAFGQIIPQDVLDIPRLGCVNVHGSLLPKYRGAAPVQWAILSGEKVTGVTTMQMDAGLDTGDMLLQREIEIGPGDTAGTMSEKLSELGAGLLIETLNGLEAGTITPRKQDDSQAGIYAKMLSKDMGELDFMQSAAHLDLQIRGLSPWPGTFTHLNGRLLHIWEAEVSPEDAADAAPGTVSAVGKNDFTVQTGEGSLIVKQVQLEGKKRMDAGAFLRGNRLQPGQRLGKE